MINEGQKRPTVRDAQEQLDAQSWSNIEQKLEKTGKHLRIKNERDLIQLSENFYQIINEQRKGQGGAVIKPMTVLKELSHNHENSTKALYGHAIKLGSNPNPAGYFSFQWISGWGIGFVW